MTAVVAGCAQSSPSAPPAPSGPLAPSNAPTVPPSEDISDPEQWQIDGETTTVGSGLDAPWSMTLLSDDTVLVSQRDDGRVVSVSPEGGSAVIGTFEDVVAGGEAGLHGLSTVEESGTLWLYAYYGSTSDNRVVRAQLRPRGDQWVMGDERETIIDGIPRGRIHNGGRIAFGPDGMLYVSTGDVGMGETAQDDTSLAGKILRATPSGDVPPDNPYGGSLVYSIGHRNVQGIAWTADGTMWATEFGANAWDELNRIEAGGNYGWPEIEGLGGADPFIDPAVVWPTDQASPSGMAAIGGTLFVASLRGERVWTVHTEGGAVVGEPSADLSAQLGRLRDVVVAPGPALFVLTNNTDGRGSPSSEDDRVMRVPLTAVDSPPR